MKDIIYITCDSLRVENISAFGYERETTPYLSSLTDEAICFPNTYSVGPASCAMSGTLTSTLPLTEGAYYSIPNSVKTIAEALPDKYTKIGIHSNSFFSEENGYHRGFDIYRHAAESDRHSNDQSNLVETVKKKTKSVLSTYEPALELAQKYYQDYKRNKGRPPDPRVNGRITNKLAVDAMKSASGPIFLWVHYMDTHSPFLPEREILDQFNPNISEEDIAQLTIYRNNHDKMDPKDSRTKKLLDLYDAEIRRTDSIIGELVETIEDDVLPSPPSIIVSADHGEAFGEHGWSKHQPEAMYDETLNIPLIIRDPDREPSKRMHPDLVSSLDIGPTICDLADCSPPETFQGDSVFDESSRRAVYGVSSHDQSGEVRKDSLNIYYRDADWEYVYREGAESELYATDGSESAIGQSLTEVPQTVRKRVAECKSRLRYSDTESLNLSKEHEDRLEALGYLEG